MRSSPLRYPGGKSRGVKFLLDFVPVSRVVREPFFGGGSMTFSLMQQDHTRLYEASDLNFDLYCFWTQLQMHPAELIEGVQQVYNYYKLYNTGFNENKAGKHLFISILGRRKAAITPLQRAIDFYILNRISFSGVVDRGGFSQASFEKRFTQSSIDKLSYSAEIVKGINFYHRDYSYLLEKPGKEVFIFLDPPYHAAAKSKLYGRGGLLHTHFDHEQLVEKLKATSHKWMITYDDSTYIRELYKGFCQYQWQLQYGMTNSQQSPSVLGSELIIANYDLQATFEKNRKEKAGTRLDSK